MSTEPSILPFPGLRPFEEGEQDLFFGREGQSEDILRRLRLHRFVAVVGASGSGKSSLIRAGLLPYLHGGFLAEASSHWRVAIFRPGGDPIKNFALTLNDPAVLGHKGENAEETAQSAVLLEVSLRRSGLGLIEAVQLARLPEGEQVLIVVDQFEELFRFADAADRPGRDEDAAAFVKLLLEASRQREQPIYVAITMRSDYIGDCARYRGLPEAVTDGLYLIPRMTRDQRRAAIVEPVRVGGGTIAPRLVVRLLNDVGDDPDQLPILQHALMRTWDHWTAQGEGRRPIDLDDYLAIGGMADALSQHADEAYDALPDDRHRAIAKRLFQALSEKGADNREARRPTTVAKLAQVVDAPLDDVVRVIDDFRATGRSFLMPAPNVTLHPDSVIDISHESLIRGWRRMRQWVEEEAESARQYRRLADTAALHAQGAAGLLHDPDLENAVVWREKAQPNAEWGNRYYPRFQQAMAFLEQSRTARETERRQRQTARRRMQVASGAAAAVITIVAIVAVWQWRQAEAESGREKQALAVTTDLAYSLVFDLAQDERLRGIAPEMLSEVLDRAIKSDDEVITIAPSAAAYASRASAYHHKQNLDQALADSSKAIQLDPTYFRAYNVRGAVYSEKKDYDRAIADFSQSIKLAPKFVFAYVNRGIAYEDKGDIDRAMADYDQAIAINPKYFGAYLDRGNVYYDRKDYDHAIADYSEAIKYDPHWAVLYNSRGRAYEIKGEFDQAIADFNQAMTLDAKNAVPYNNRGYAYFRKQDYDRAIADYDQAIKLDPKYALAYDNRGQADLNKQEFDRAIADEAQAVALDPKNAAYYNNRGYAYYRKKDYDRAIADYDQAIKLDAKDALAHDNLGDAHRAKGDLDRAIADYTQAVMIDPKYAAAYDDRGNAYEAKGDPDHAIADYDHAITLDPKFASAYNNRGSAYNAKGDRDHAITNYTQAIALDPQNPDYYDNRGVAHYLNSDYKDAITDYDKAIKIDPKSSTAYFTRGLADVYEGSLSRALADLAESSNLNPKDAYAALWLDIVSRSNRPSRLAQAATQIDMSAWPAPVIRMYLGQLTPAQLQAAAENPDPTTRRGQRCEANFYTGELLLRQNAKDAALHLFRLAVADCPKDYYELGAAQGEVTAFGDKPDGASPAGPSGPPPHY